MSDIQKLRATNHQLDAKVGAMEKEALIRENSSNNFSTLNTSKGDIASLSLRDLRKEDHRTIEDLNDQIRTKEEEIQILWNVIKEINKIKGGNFNIGQLQKLVIRSEAATLRQSNQSENLQSMYATPGHPNG